MSNKASPHGGTFHEGTITYGTLRLPDLLRSFASEFERLKPFGAGGIAAEARGFAEQLDEQGEHPPSALEAAQEVLEDLRGQLDDIAGMHGCYFGSIEGDGADIGFWRIDAEGEE